MTIKTLKKYKEFADPQVRPRYHGLPTFMRAPFCEDLAEVGSPESPPKMLGRALSVILAPGGTKPAGVKKKTEKAATLPPSTSLKNGELT